MQIEIAEPGRMTQTGSSLQRLIQNNNMPVLDLLVRESIQNSLDAKKQNSKYVEVDFLTGQFNSEKLARELDDLTEPLINRYGSGKYDYIAVRDSHTVGLTGVMDYKKVKDNSYGNLLKLVYEICKPQEAEGAGGSWGIGKTVYFRIGIGLVIYYSRIINEDGEFESRLAASLVENETSPNAMIPTYKDMSKRGIAWWGESIGENVTQPVTDEKYVASFLKIFGIEKYDGDDTGTTIIIPFIDSEELLSNNRIEYFDEHELPIIPYWGYRIEDYISISAQRWYAPRLNNPHYLQGAYLRMRINNRGICFDDMEPVFKVIQSLYNRASYIEEDDILSSVDDKKIEKISVRKYLEDSTIGVLAVARITRELLKMNAPDNKPEPYMYFNTEIRDAEVNKPTVCFTRKPAMVVSYENVGAWVSNIAPTSKDEYIIGLFVLNSFNPLKNSPSTSTIEEYIRKSEMADHTSWSDWSDGRYNPRFVSKIQSGVNKIIAREFSGPKEAETPKNNSGLGKMLGELLLPPDGFGKGASPDDKKNNGGSGTGTARSKFRFLVDNSKVQYESNKMIIPVVLDTSPKKKITRASFDILIDSESKKIDINEWEEKMGLSCPFKILNYNVLLEVVDGEKINRECFVTAEDDVEIEGIRLRGMNSKKGTCHGLSIISDGPHYIKMQIEVVLLLNRKDIKPSFSFEKEIQ